jgi:CRP-like cAMP-binding protein
VCVGEGELVFGRGLADGQFFIVVSGLIEVEREEPRLRARFGPLDLVCGYGAFGYAEEHYTARARKPSTVLRVSEEAFFDLMEVHFDIARSVLAGMTIERERLMRQSRTERP